MVTQLQLDTFRDAYDEESTRHKELGTLANVYLSINTFFLGGLFFSLKIVLRIAAASSLAEGILVTTWLAFFGSLACTALSVFVQDFKVPFHPEHRLKELDQEEESDDEFRLKQLALFAASTTDNITMNDRSAGWLQYSGYLLLFGFAAAITFLIVSTTVSVNLGE